ncbi:MarR family winged helix-turn-helix transcriptional regulator [Hyphomonas pacifica]|uniref:MarR family transcriptional regulator n=1 Tax=Hyphomonas pacifica TaxID=1280941 RepID=A0A062U2K7_9PROT|nr:MarR family transcriptional regulator [Hyphomonas pacifica]KCZ50849.1 MarR family transcriptional regulator [Hyphomonas pacifica]RAN33379.1 MarR family transcriptional regulator [Hyphomonas pacifica]RAN34539.1 MarR family transcriptional regulator [Hyphomonas pacifica]
MMIAELQETADLSLGESFLKSLSLLEQAHRRLHDVVKDDLERAGERSLTGVQALLLYEIGEGEAPASVLRARGAFAGTSLSYNVKKLQEGGYLIQTRSEDDKRTVTLRLTERGLKVRKRVASLFEKQAGALEPTASVRPDDLSQLNKTISRLERFWSDQIRFRL